MTFGEDRVVFGTDWPNSWGTATPAQIVDSGARLFRHPHARGGGEVFLEELAGVYKWKKRAANQPSL